MVMQLIELLSQSAALERVEQAQRRIATRAAARRALCITALAIFFGTRRVPVGRMQQAVDVMARVQYALKCRCPRGEKSSNVNNSILAFSSCSRWMTFCWRSSVRNIFLSTVVPWLDDEDMVALASLSAYVPVRNVDMPESAVPFIIPVRGFATGTPSIDASSSMSDSRSRNACDASRSARMFTSA